MVEISTIRKSYLHKFLDAAKGKEWVLFGAGQAGISAPDYLNAQDIYVKYYVDNDRKKWGKTFNGYDIKPPDDLASENDPNVLITSAYVIEIKNQLQGMGIKNVYNLPGIGNHHNIHELFDSSIISTNKGKIYELEKILADKESLYVLNNVLKGRVTGDFTYFDLINTKEIYFPHDLIKLTGVEVFVDAGAYIGDTIKKFIEITCGSYNKIIAFEPDYENFSQLKESIKNIGENILLHQKAVYDRNGYISFNSEYGLASSVADQGEEEITVCKIDDILNKDDQVTFIKMDVEGSELKALWGAKDTIQRYSPKLAICVYHLPEDIWDIALYIHSICPHYRIYLRHHSPSCTDTVFYAV